MKILKAILVATLALVSTTGKCQFQGNIDLGINYGLNKKFESYLTDSTSYQQLNSLGYGYGFRYLSKKNFFVGVNGYITNFKLVDDNLKFKITQRVLFINFGYQKGLSTKLKLEANISGVLAKSSLEAQNVSFQEISLSENSTYNTITKISKLGYSLGYGVTGAYSILSNSALTVGVNGTFFSLSELQEVDNIDIFSNFFFLKLGLRFNINFITRNEY